MAYERLHDRLFSRTKSILTSDEDANDVLQEAFYRLWKARPAITGQSHADGLLVRTVHNLAIDTYRNATRHAAVSIEENYTDTPVADDTEERQELLDNVNHIISRHLSARDREILLKRDSMGWEFEEIAAEYGLTPGNVRIIVSRARRTVREIYRTINTTKVP